ncbi:MAG: cyclopropane-fatty-acyl-phospholipid synthase family protein [Mesorhizobium sp.]|nr:cyclopropane-fatty-acyl-phospholipid synthase family protein [Mesorhizobium sp.]
MNRLLQNLVRRLVLTGDLSVTGPSGATHRFGDGTGEHVHARIRNRRAELAITFDPSLALAEAYMDGDVEIIEGDIFGLIRIAYQNMGPSGVEAVWAKALDGLRFGFRRLQQINTAARARQNVHRHYDLSGDLYRLFLDSDMQYSCAYFDRPGMSLDEAQDAKKRHIAAKLLMKEGLSVLDIGSGWGGLGLYIARQFEADVLGVTLSTEQHAVATARAQEEHLDNHVHFELRDYRDIQERFDRIVSVGMFEHVGVNHYTTFFDKAASMLKPDGVMLLHTIGRTGMPVATNAFIRKHIFPGGHIPALSEMLPSIERSGLMITDVEILRLHYAETLRHWRERFLANKDAAAAIYDERFVRMWEFYLAGSEASFRWQDLVVFQIQLARRHDVVPITRDYIAEAEHGFADAPVATAVAKGRPKAARRQPAR